MSHPFRNQAAQHSSLPYRIVHARPQDVARLPAIELAAARLLSGHAPESILTETTSFDVLSEARREGRLWVAIAQDVPVGFALAGRREPRVAHLEEMDVLPEHGRRGLGARLLETVCGWAAEHAHDIVTLTTFRGLPWNMPFYARHGFEEIPPHELSAAMQAVLEDEARRGLNLAQRVAMRRPLE